MTMERRLIINCDDFGQSTAMNEAIRHLLEENKVSSATIMTVAPGFEEAASWAAHRRQPNIGLHLTMTSEFEALRWSSLTGHSSLHDANGYQYRTVAEFERGQKQALCLKRWKRSINWHARWAFASAISIIIWAVCTGWRQGGVLFRRCCGSVRAGVFRHGYSAAFIRKTHCWPSNIERPVALASGLADTFGVPIPDYLLSHPFPIVEGETYESFKQSLIDKLYRLPEGVSETYVHPGAEDEWMLANIPNWEKRVWEYRLLFDDDFAYGLRDAKVILTDYRYVEEHLKRPRVRSAVKLMKVMTKKS